MSRQEIGDPLAHHVGGLLRRGHVEIHRAVQTFLEVPGSRRGMRESAPGIMTDGALSAISSDGSGPVAVSRSNNVCPIKDATAR